MTYGYKVESRHLVQIDVPSKQIAEIVYVIKIRHAMCHVRLFESGSFSEERSLMMRCGFSLYRH